MITRRLICVLNDDDILDRGQKLANAEFHYRETKAEKKVQMDAFKKSLEAIDSRMSELSDAIRERKEIRDVGVMWQNNHARLSKELSGSIPARSWRRSR